MAVTGGHWRAPAATALLSQARRDRRLAMAEEQEKEPEQLEDANLRNARAAVTCLCIRHLITQVCSARRSGPSCPVHRPDLCTWELA